MGTKLCRLIRNGVWSLRPWSHPAIGPWGVGRGEAGVGWWERRNGETLLRAGTLSILMSPISLLVRGVKKEDKTLAVGIQFMLLRVLGKGPTWDHWSRYCVPGLRAQG